VEKKLLARLSSLKQYFMLQAGDLFVHFLDSAEGELAKDPKLISREKLQSLLEISVRSSSAERDPYKDDVSCYLAAFTYPKILASYQSSYKKDLLTTLDFMQRGEAVKETTNNSKGFEYFTLDYHAEWPLCLILTDANVLLYKLLFKNLFSLHYVQRELFHNWKSNQSMKNFDIPKPAKVHFLFVQRMLNFVNNVLNNFCHEVIENHWKVLVDNINNVSSN
jgi:gamma-tubulin complex component 2